MGSNAGAISTNKLHQSFSGQSSGLDGIGELLFQIPSLAGVEGNKGQLLGHDGFRKVLLEVE